MNKEELIKLAENQISEANFLGSNFCELDLKDHFVSNSDYADFKEYFEKRGYIVSIVGESLINIHIPKVNISELKKRYQNHIRAAEEMARRDQEWFECIDYILKHKPEWGDTTGGLLDLIKLLIIEKNELDSE